MKFAKTLERTLVEEDIPEEWISAAIQYKALKKCISKVVSELEFLGLKHDTLKLLLQNSSSVVELDQKDATANNPAIAEYTLTKGNDKLQPTLKITLDYSNQAYTDDHIYELGMELKRKIEGLMGDEKEKEEKEKKEKDEEKEKIEEVEENEEKEKKNENEESGDRMEKGEKVGNKNAAKNGNLDVAAKNAAKNEGNENVEDSSIEESFIEESFIEESSPILELHEGNELVITPTNSRTHSRAHPRDIYISLNSDKKFFWMLDRELDSLDQLRESEEQKLSTEVQAIGQQIRSLTSPKMRLKDSDLYKWRELFKIYLDSEVYFKYNETTVSARERDSNQIKDNLAAFMEHVQQSGILGTFKSKASGSIFQSFVAMNYHLLKVCQFQQINSEAFRKILKKFDKQTALGVSSRFPKIMASNHVFVSTGRSMAQNICFVIQTSVLTLIPQIDDYTCPICMSIAFKPIRLMCGHVFCVRCLVKMKSDGKTDCPMCRNKHAIAKADGGNLDMETMELMKRCFPREVKEKVRDREREKYEEMRGGEKCVIQ